MPRREATGVKDAAGTDRARRTTGRNDFLEKPRNTVPRWAKTASFNSLPGQAGEVAAES
jgi:hypothetical protein